MNRDAPPDNPPDPHDDPAPSGPGPADPSWRVATLLSLSVLALAAAIPVAIMALPIDPDDAPIREYTAGSFIDGNLIRGDAAGNAEVVVPLGAPPFRVTYTVRVARAGRYRLDMRIASRESRPVTVILDGETLGEHFAATTIDYERPSFTWVPGPVCSLRENTPQLLILHSKGFFPHFDRFRLVRLDESTPDRRPAP